MQSGAELLATISHKHIDKNTDKEVEVAIKASFVSGSGSGETSSSQKSSMQRSELEINTLQIGGGEGILAISQENLKEKLTTLQTEASKAPAFYDIYIVPYDILYLEAPEFSFSDTQSAEELLIDQYLEIKTLHANISQYLNNPTDYYQMSVDPITLSEHYRLCLMELEKILKSNVFFTKDIDKLRTKFIEASAKCSLINADSNSAAKLTTQETIIQYFLPQLTILSERIKGPIFKAHYKEVTDKQHQEEFFNYEVMMPTRRACDRYINHNDCVSERELSSLRNKYIGLKFKLKHKSGDCLYSDGLWNGYKSLFMGSCSDGKEFVFQLGNDDQLLIIKSHVKSQQDQCIENSNDSLMLGENEKRCKTTFKLENGRQRFLRVFVNGEKKKNCHVDNSRGRNSLKSYQCSDFEAVFVD